MARLIVANGVHRGREHELGEVTVLGRIPEVEIQVEDTKASRRHTRIVLSAGAFFCEDMGSRNGTQVNNKSITRVKLRDGDMITIGTSEFKFVDPTATVVAEPKATPTAHDEAATQTVEQRKAVRPAAPTAAAAVARVGEQRFDPRALASQRTQPAWFLEDLDQRPWGFRFAVYAGGFAALGVIAGLSYLLTLLVLG